MRGSAGGSTQLVKQWPGSLIKERHLPLVADLHNRQVSEARLPVRLHCLNDCIKIRAAGVSARRRLPVGRTCWLPRTLPASEGQHSRPSRAEPAELIMGALDRALLVRIPADWHLADLARVRALLPVPGLDQLLFWFHSHEMISQWRELSNRLLTRHRNGDRYATLRRVPHPSRIDTEVIALPSDQLRGLQLTDDGGSLDQLVLALRDRRPALADDVLVEVLS
jgi:hypothetical protein